MSLDFYRMKKWSYAQFHIITMVAVWADAYKVPVEVIERQIGIAYGWSLCNPRQAPRKNIPRFINNWLRKAHKFGNLAVRPGALTYQEQKVNEEDIMTGEDFTRMKEALRQPLEKKEK